MGIVSVLNDASSWSSPTISRCSDSRSSLSSGIYSTGGRRECSVNFGDGDKQTRGRLGHSFVRLMGVGREAEQAAVEYRTRGKYELWTRLASWILKVQAVQGLRCYGPVFPFKEVLLKPTLDSQTTEQRFYQIEHNAMYKLWRDKQHKPFASHLSARLPH